MATVKDKDVKYSKQYGKLHMTCATHKTYICGSVCTPRHIVTITSKQCANHRDLVKQCFAMALNNKTKEEIKAFVASQLAMQ